MFDVAERVAMLEEIAADLPNVSVESFEGLLVDFCRARSIPVVVKGLRAVSDFEYELQMAQMNQRLSGLDTMFVTTDPLYSFLSSSLVKEVAAYGGDVEGLVPPAVHDRLKARLAEQPGLS
jgi:pantetheine-phosphate adenylyltransferase